MKARSGEQISRFTFHVSHFTHLATCILLLAAVLRFAAFDEALVGADQSSILSAAADIAALRDFPGVGIKSSIGVMQTAVTPYIAAIPLLFVRRVIAVKWFFSALDLLALALLFQAVKRVFNPQAALITALLYATNPWIVEFIRWIWYQTLIPTFATVAFAAFLLLLAKKKLRANGLLVLGLVSATLLGMVHLAGVPWAGLLFVLGAFLAWKKRLWWGFAVGCGLSLFIAFPYLRYLFQTNFADIALLLQSNNGESSSLNWATYRLSWELLTGAQVLQTPRDPLWAESVLQLPQLYVIMPVALALATISTGWQLLHGHAHSRGPLSFVLIWTLLAPTLFVPTSIHLQHFYLLFLFPAPFVLIGVGLQASSGSAFDRISARVWRWSRGVMIMGLVVLAIWWTHLWLVRVVFEQQGKLRAPTRAWLMDKTVDIIRTYLVTESDRHLILITDFEGGDLSQFDWMRNFIHDDRLRIVPKGAGLIIPPGPTCYLLAQGATLDDLHQLADQVTENTAMAIPATRPWRSYCLPERATIPLARAQWQNGMALLDAQITGEFVPGGRLDIVYTWHYEALIAKEYHIFSHLMFRDTLVAQVDGVGVPTWYWRDDDVLITRFPLYLPATLENGMYDLHTGAYTWPDVERVFLTDESASYIVTQWAYEK